MTRIPGYQSYHMTLVACCSEPCMLSCSPSLTLQTSPQPAGQLRLTDLHALPQHVICLAECIIEAGGPVCHVQQLVIGDNDQAVHTLLQSSDALHGLVGTPATLKAEGVGHNRHCQDAYSSTYTRARQHVKNGWRDS